MHVTAEGLHLTCWLLIGVMQYMPQFEDRYELLLLGVTTRINGSLNKDEEVRESRY
jgi:hypothetical protein